MTALICVMSTGFYRTRSIPTFKAFSMMLSSLDAVIATIGQCFFFTFGRLMSPSLQSSSYQTFSTDLISTASLTPSISGIWMSVNTNLK